MTFKAVNKRLAKLMCAVIALTAVFAMPGQEVEAASKKAKFSYTTVDRTKEYPKVTAHVYFKYPKLKGSGKAVKRINKMLKKEAGKFVNSREANGLYSSAEAGSAIETQHINFYCTQSGKVTYNKNNLISIRYANEWYAGGVSNFNWYGDTFNIRTGKRMKITQVVSKKYGKTSKLKNAIYNRLANQYGSGVADNFRETYNTSKKIKNAHFYMNKKGKVVVCFETYEINDGIAGCLTVTLPSRY